MSFQTRQTCVYLISYICSNPNGSPTANNEPRSIIHPNGDVEGYTTDVSLKRLIRDTAEEKFGQALYVKRHTRPFEQNQKFCKDLPRDKSGFCEKGKERALKECFDIRLFGLTGIDGTDRSEGESGAKPKDPKAPKEKKENLSLGTETGPVQVTNGLSLNSVEIIDDTISKVSHSSKENVGTFGTHKYIRFGLYHHLITCNPFRAKRTGCSQDDLEIMYKACAVWPRVLGSRSKTGEVAACFVFDHGCDYGRATDQHLQRIVLAGTRCKCDDPKSLQDYRLPTLEFVKFALKKCGLDGIKVRDILSENSIANGTSIPSLDDFDAAVVAAVR